MDLAGLNFGSGRTGDDQGDSLAVSSSAVSDTLCPACGQAIPIDAINIAEGVALCRPCGKLHRLADLLDAATPDPDLIDSPPRGCRWDDTGFEVVVSASMRSVAGTGFLLLFAAFWNSIVSVFIFIAAAGLYTNLVGPLPWGLAAPTSKNGAPMTLGMSIFLCFFLIPFILVGVCMGTAAMLSLFGRLVVTVRGPEGAVRTAIGPFGFTRRFDASAVRRVVITHTDSENGRRRNGIRIEADRTISFGSLLPDHRRDWLAAVLRTLLEPAQGNRRGPRLSPATL